MTTDLRARMAADVATPKELLDVGAVWNTVEHLLEVQEQRAILARKLEVLDAEIKRISEEDLPTLFDAAGINDLQVHGHRVIVETKYFPNVLKVNEPMFFSWLRNHGHAALIKNEVKVTFGKGQDDDAKALRETLENEYSNVAQKQMVHPSTLRAFVREQIDAGNPLPDVVDINAVRTTTIKDQRWQREQPK